MTKCKYKALSPSLSLSGSVLTTIFPGEPGLAGFIEAKDDGSGGDNWSCKSYKAPVKSSPPTMAVTVLVFHFQFGFGRFSQKTVVLVFHGFGFYMKYG